MNEEHTYHRSIFPFAPSIAADMASSQTSSSVIVGAVLGGESGGVIYFASLQLRPSLVMDPRGVIFENLGPGELGGVWTSGFLAYSFGRRVLFVDADSGSRPGVLPRVQSPLSSLPSSRGLEQRSPSEDEN